MWLYICLALSLLACGDVSYAANASVTWNASPEQDLAGYKIYKRTLPSINYGSPIFSGLPSNPSSPQITITNLLEGTSYGFIATAFDSSGNESGPSTEEQFTIPISAVAPSVTMPPTDVTVTAPTSATFNVGASGTAPLSYQWQRNGIAIAGATSATYLLVPTTVADSGAQFAVVVSNMAGTVTSPAATLTVTTPPAPDTTSPSLSLTTPSQGSTVAGIVTLTATATDNVGVVGVQFHLNGSNLGAEDTTNSYGIPWDTTTVGNGTYTLSATARDAAGNTHTSASVPVTVNNLSGPQLLAENFNDRTFGGWTVVDEGATSAPVCLVSLDGGSGSKLEYLWFNNQSPCKTRYLCLLQRGGNLDRLPGVLDLPL